MIDRRGFHIDERWDEVSVTDAEKNAAVNRAAAALAERAARAETERADEADDEHTRKAAR